MAFFNREYKDNALAKANQRITILEDKLSTALAKIDALIYENRDLKLQIKTLTAKVETLTSANKILIDENAQLKKRLKIDSSNSNMPSSTNIFNAPIPNRPTVSNRDKSNKKSGGQTGHDGNTLEFTINQSHITNTINHQPQSCLSCGVELSNFTLIDTRQVHDVIIKRTITNHYIYSGICLCGRKTLLNSTNHIPHGVSYGANIKSIILYLHNKDLLPTKRLTETAYDLFNLPISEGTIYKWQSELSNNLNHYENELISLLLKQITLHVDESGFKITNLKQWLHVISTTNYTYYDIHNKRGMDALIHTNILPQYTGNLMHDCFKTYHTLPHIKQHGLCNAHLLRELKSMDQFYKLSFANKMRELLIEMNIKSKSNQLTYQTTLQYKASFKKLITLAEKEALTLTNIKWQKDVLALANRLKEHGSKYLAFLDNKQIPFTNNQALRHEVAQMSCLHRKIEDHYYYVMNPAA